MNISTSKTYINREVPLMLGVPLRQLRRAIGEHGRLKNVYVLACEWDEKENNSQSGACSPFLTSP